MLSAAVAEKPITPVKDMKVLIIGGGFSGLGMAINLKRSGEDSFTVFEKEPRIGGTWWVNQYPGCACDVESHLYSFSFELNPDWSSMFPTQPEIQAYMERCAEKYRVVPHFRFSTEITQLKWDEASLRWQAKDAHGHRYTAQFVVSGAGGLSVAAYPDIEGVKTFGGKMFHSQQWDHGYDLNGKRIAVIGTGASAIQFVPQIQPDVAHLDLYQRTPPWILPKMDRPMTETEKQRFRKNPFRQRLLRSKIYWLKELGVPGFDFFRPMMRLARSVADRHRARQVSDPVLREKLTPTYTIGCKRILISNDYYPAVSAPNVTLVTEGISAITPTGIRTVNGRERPADAIVFGTGFNIANLIPKGMIFGRGGIDITDAWARGMEAHKGTTVAGFPNLFILLGPNTGLGHNSIIYMIEAQIAYIMDALRFMKKRDVAAIDTRPQAQARWNDEVQRRLSRTVWNTGGCKSWYLHPVSGRNFTLWPGFTWRFRRLLSRFDPASYTVTGEPSGQQDAPAAF